MPGRLEKFLEEIAMDEQKIRNYLLKTVMPGKGQIFEKHLRFFAKIFLSDITQRTNIAIVLTGMPF
jgi:hypothetical protein